MEVMVNIPRTSLLSIEGMSRRPQTEVGLTRPIAAVVNRLAAGPCKIGNFIGAVTLRLGPMIQQLHKLQGPVVFRHMNLPSLNPGMENGLGFLRELIGREMTGLVG